MTKLEKAIDILRQFQNPEPWDPEITDEAAHALGMAIEALEFAEVACRKLAKMGLNKSDNGNYLGRLPSAQPEIETAKFIRWMECKKTANYISYTPHCKCSKCGTELLLETIKYCYMCGARMEED